MKMNLGDSEFENLRGFPTDALIAVCRSLIKRADSPAIKAAELEQLRVVAAELRRRATLSQSLCSAPAN